MNVVLSSFRPLDGLALSSKSTLDYNVYKSAMLSTFHSFDFFLAGYALVARVLY